MLTSPELHDVLSLLKGLRNGFVYGVKIRFPHSLVMTFLFRNERYSQPDNFSLKKKLRFIMDATLTHGSNLAKFCFIYKFCMIAMRKIMGEEKSIHAFISGLIGGYVVFRSNSPVNQQIILYLTARVLMGFFKLASNRQLLPDITTPKGFNIHAAVIWGLVMWLFRHETDVLQPSLQASMQYIYNDSEKWSDLRTLLWHNK